MITVHTCILKSKHFAKIAAKQLNWGEHIDRKNAQAFTQPVLRGLGFGSYG
jgi:hypothetical protein